MLAVSANWGLTDGSLGGRGAAAASAWLDHLRAAVVRAGWGPAGRYQPVERLTFVLAGDTFDLLFSARWQGRGRPWHGGRQAREARLAVAAEAVAAARRPIARLCRWVREGLAVPAADGRGRPLETIRARVEVEVVVLDGDRDVGLASLAGGPTWRGLRVGSAWCDDRHAISHGQEFDPMRFVELGAASRHGVQPTLGESLVVDLIVPFAVAIRSMPGNWERVRPMLTDLAAADLVDMVPAVARLIARFAAGGPNPVAIAWRRAVDGWIGAVRREPPGYETGCDVSVDLATWLATAAEAGSTGPVPAVIRWLAAAAPPAVPGQVCMFGHLPAAATATEPVLGLGGKTPTLVVQPRPARPLEIVNLETRLQEPAIVRIGAPAAGRGSIDAA